MFSFQSLKLQPQQILTLSHMSLFSHFVGAWIGTIFFMQHAHAQCQSSSSLSITYNSFLGYANKQNGIAASGDAIDCCGSFSCYNTTMIKQTGDQGYINCFGLFSCANVPDISLMKIKGTLSCYGERSCSYSNINLGDAYVLCSGAHSCADSVIYGGETDGIHLNGYAAAENSIFYSANNSYNSYWFSGMLSGNNATVICQNNNVCNLTCYVSGCTNLNLVSKNDATFWIDCTESDLNDICNGSNTNNYNNYNILHSYNNPNLANYNINMPNLTNVTMSSIENSLPLCLASMTDNDHNCSTEKQCTSFGISSDETLCCSGSESCDGILNISVTDNNGLMRCDGFGSCYNINHDTGRNGFVLSKENGGNIYLPAYFSGAESRIYGTNKCNGDYSSSASDIICSGLSSCDSKEGKGEVKYARYVYCTGEESCVATIIQYVEDVYFYGLKSGHDTVIKNIGGNVYCVTEQGCKSVTIDNVNGNVVANGFSVLEEATIENVKGGVYGFGYEALSSTWIFNVTNVG